MTYEEFEMPENPSDEDVANAIGILMCRAMHMGGAIAAGIQRIPTSDLPKEARTFYFDFMMSDVTEQAEAVMEAVVAERTETIQ